MKPTVVLAFILVVFATANCKHTFLGTNVLRPLVAQVNAKYSSYLFQKRIEYYAYTIPHVPANMGKSIRGILAYDLTNSGASCNVTEGGLGFSTVKLRMKSDRGKALNYQIYIYA